MSKWLDTQPLDQFLYVTEKSIRMNNPLSRQITRKEFVRGMGVRGLIYHWDDCALDCLNGKVTTEQGTRINEIVAELHCDELFELAMKEVDPIATPILSEQIEEVVKEKYIVKGDPYGTKIPMFIDTEGKHNHNCHCNIKDLATWGCKCGGI